MNAFYITTPIYYPNGEPHLGSIYTTVVADVLAHYHRLKGEETFFLTGTDEHGTKMAKAAAAQGIEPIALADRYANLFKDVWRELQVTNDDFIRTTDARHKDQVQRIVEQLVKTGDIYLGSYQGWYDEGQEEFVTETEAKGNSYKSAISGKPLTRYSEPSYFFRLSKYVPRVLEYIEQHPDFIIPESRRNEVTSKIKAGVEDLSISRATLKWGIPLPHDPGHVLYVWIDALSNYITALNYAGSDRALFEKFWPANVHVIGKDILWFHTVYWPAILFALNLPLPRTIAAHGWWTQEGGKKAGKSTGGITSLAEIRQVVSSYGLDGLRYYLLRAAPFGSDLEWNRSELDKSYNELGNVLGNLLNRVVNMIGKYRAGKVPPAIPSPSPGTPGEGRGEGSLDEQLIAATGKLPSQITHAYERLELQQACLLPIELARVANGYVDATRPFSLAKDPAQSARLDTVLNLSAQATKNALVALLPILPEKAAAGLGQLGIASEDKTLDQLFSILLAPNSQLGPGQPLFPKVEGKSET